MRASNPTFDGTVRVNGGVIFDNATGDKVYLYADGGALYGMGVAPQEYAFFADSGGYTFRVGFNGMAGAVAATITATGLNATPVGTDAPAAGRFTAVTASTSLVVDGVNDLRLVGAAAGAAPAVIAEGADANVSLALDAKGTGSVLLRCNGVTGFQANAPASAANWIQASAATTGNTPVFQPIGADANIGIWFAGKGTGTVFFSPRGAAAVAVVNPASPVNYWQFSGSATGGAISAAAVGTDANIGIAFTPKGTGTVGIAAAAITGGAINATPIGGTTPAAVTATALTSTGYRYRSAATGLSAAGTTQATATAINRSTSVFTTVASGAGAVLPNVPPVTVGGVATFAEFEVFNAGANALLLYPASGLAINALAANAALSVAAGGVARGVQISTAAYRFG